MTSLIQLTCPHACRYTDQLGLTSGEASYSHLCLSPPFLTLYVALLFLSSSVGRRIWRGECLWGSGGGRGEEDERKALLDQVLWTLVIKGKEKPDITHGLGTPYASPHMASLNSLS